MKNCPLPTLTVLITMEQIIVFFRLRPTAPARGPSVLCNAQAETVPMQRGIFSIRLEGDSLIWD